MSFSTFYMMIYSSRKKALYKKKVPPKDSTFLCIFGKFLVKPIVVVNRTHKQALKTAVSLVFSVYSEFYKAIFSPGASLWGTG